MRSNVMNWQREQKRGQRARHAGDRDHMRLFAKIEERIPPPRLPQTDSLGQPISLPRVSILESAE